jgi:hypothetical protein
MLAVLITLVHFSLSPTKSFFVQLRIGFIRRRLGFVALGFAQRSFLVSLSLFLLCPYRKPKMLTRTR